MCWQVENVECMPGDHIKFDFLGKDSIRYENEVVVNPKVYQLIKKFCQQFANKKRKFFPLHVHETCTVCSFPACSSPMPG